AAAVAQGQPAGAAAKAADPFEEVLRRVQARRNLRKIAEAIQIYHHDHAHLPPPAIMDKQDKPLLSWRVALLPYLGPEGLYEQFKPDGAWDSPHNKKLLARMPAVFAAVGPKAAKNTTNYQYVVGPTAVFSSHRMRPDRRERRIPIGERGP